jgi:hypothetical protein
MRGVQRIRHLDGYLQQRRSLEWSARDAVPECDAIQKLHHDERRVRSSGRSAPNSTRAAPFPLNSIQSKGLTEIILHLPDLTPIICFLDRWSKMAGLSHFSFFFC